MVKWKMKYSSKRKLGYLLGNKRKVQRKYRNWKKIVVGDGLNTKGAGDGLSKKERILITAKSVKNLKEREMPRQNYWDAICIIPI